MRTRHEFHDVLTCAIMLDPSDATRSFFGTDEMRAVKEALAMLKHVNETWWHGALPGNVRDWVTDPD